MAGLVQLDDTKLILKTLRGNDDAFGVLITRYLYKAHTVAYAQAWNDGDAEDATQEAFMEAYQQLDKLRDSRKFSSWLTTIVRRKAQRIAQRRQRERAVTSTLIPPIPETPAPEQQELKGILQQKIKQLDPMPREVLLLHYFTGCDTAEIAMIQGVSREAVKKRLQRARETLGQALLEQYADTLEIKQPDGKRCLTVFVAVTGAAAPWKSLAAGGVLGGTVTLKAGGLLIVTSIILAVCCYIVIQTDGLMIFHERSDVLVDEANDGTPPQEGHISATTETKHTSRGEEFPDPPSAQFRVSGCIEHVRSRERVPDVDVMAWGKDGQAVGVARSDAQGVFTLDIVYPEFDSDNGSQLVIKIAHPSLILATGKQLKTRLPFRAEKSLTLTVTESRSLTGRVLDEDTNEPVGGLRVYLRDNILDNQGIQTDTDAQGRFRFTSLLPGHWMLTLDPNALYYQVTPGYEDNSIQITHTESDSMLEVRVRKGTLVAGRFINDAGEGVKTLYGIDLQGRRHIKNLISDPEGYFETVIPLYDGGYFSFRAWGSTVNLPDGSSRELIPEYIGPYSLETKNLEALQLRLRPCAQIQGRVVDHDGETLPKVSVMIEKLDETEGFKNPKYPRKARYLEETEFIFSPLDAGQYRVYPRTSVTGETMGHEGEVITVDWGERIDDLTLQYPESLQLGIRGKVIGVGVQPAPLCDVTLLQWESRIEKTTQTLADGSFSFEKLQAGECRIIVRTKEKVPLPMTTGEIHAFELMSAINHVEAGKQNLVMPLQALGIIEGQVIDDSSGAPIERFSADTSHEMGDVNEEMKVMRQATTRPEGRFRFTGFAPGNREITFKAAGYATANQRITIPSGTEGPVTMMVRLQRGINFTGYVVDNNNDPVPGASMAIHNTHLPGTTGVARVYKTARTDAAGVVSFSGLPAGMLQLVIEHPAYCTYKEPVEMVADTSEMTFQLERGGRIVGYVTDNGQPPEKFQVRLRYAMDATPAIRPDGTFIVKNMPPGEESVSIIIDHAAQTKISATQTVVIESGKDTQVSFLFEAMDASLTGQVTVVGMPEVDGIVYVMMQTAAGNVRTSWEHMEANGHYSIAELLPGMATLYTRVNLRPGFLRISKQNIDIQPGEARHFDMAATTALTIHIDPGSYASYPWAMAYAGLYPGEYNFSDMSELEQTMEWASTLMKCAYAPVITFPHSSTGHHTLLVVLHSARKAGEEKVIGWGQHTVELHPDHPAEITVRLDSIMTP